MRTIGYQPVVRPDTQQRAEPPVTDAFTGAYQLSPSCPLRRASRTALSVDSRLRWSDGIPIVHDLSIVDDRRLSCVVRPGWAGSVNLRQLVTCDIHPMQKAEVVMNKKRQGQVFTRPCLCSTRYSASAYSDQEALSLMHLRDSGLSRPLAIASLFHSSHNVALKVFLSAISLAMSIPARAWAFSLVEKSGAW